MKKYFLAILLTVLTTFAFSNKVHAANVEPLCTYTLTSNVNSNMNLCDSKLSQIKYVEFVFGVNSDTNYMTAGYNTFTINNRIGRVSYMFGYDDVLPYSILQSTSGVSDTYPLVINFYDQLPGPAQEPCPTCPEPLPPDRSAIMDDFHNVFLKVFVGVIPISAIIFVVWFMIDMLSSLMFGRGK